MKRRLVKKEDVEYIRKKMICDSSQKIANHLGLSRSVVQSWRSKLLLGQVSEEVLEKINTTDLQKKRIEYIHANVAIKSRREMAEELGICYSNLVTLTTSLGYKSYNRDSPAKPKRLSEKNQTRVLKMPSKTMWEMDNAGLIRWDIFATHPAYVDENGDIHKVVFVS